MLFKSLRVYHIQNENAISVDVLNKKLTTHEFQSVADSSVSKAKNLGWYAPAFFAYDDRLVYELGAFTIICLRTEERKIKPSMVASKLRLRIKEHTDKTGERPKNGVIKQYKEEIESVLLRRIPPQDSYTYAMFDHKKNRILVDATSSAIAEDFLGFLRKTLGSLQVEPWYTSEAPGTVFTRWLSDEYISEPFSFGEEAVLKAPGERESKVSLTNHALICEEVAVHLNADKMVQKIGLIYDNQVSFTIDCDLAISKLSFLDFDVDLKDQDPVQAFDTTYSLVSIEYQTLLNALDDLLSQN